jgi:hypothetical protein
LHRGVSQDEGVDERPLPGDHRAIMGFGLISMFGLSYPFPLIGVVMLVVMGARIAGT